MVVTGLSTAKWRGRNWSVAKAVTLLRLRSVQRLEAVNMKCFHMDQENPSAEIVNLAASRLREGAVIVFPTETVYGLGALADGGACYGAEELFDIKDRPLELPIPMLVLGEDSLDVYGVDVPEYAHKLAKAFWPGAITLVVKASDKVLKEFRAADDDTIGLRCPDNELVRELMLAAGGPLYATSANTHGKPAPTAVGEIEGRIFEAADIVLDGGSTAHGLSSTVVLCTGDAPVVVRQGVISDEDIEAAVK